MEKITLNDLYVAQNGPYVRVLYKDNKDLCFIDNKQVKGFDEEESFYLYGEEKAFAEKLFIIYNTVDSPEFPIYVNFNLAEKFRKFVANKYFQGNKEFDLGNQITLEEIKVLEHELNKIREHQQHFAEM